MNEKTEEMVNKGKSIARAGFSKGNELMDKVPVLKSKRNKLIAWGVLGIVIVGMLVAIFWGGDSEEAAVAELNESCKAWLCERYGKDSIKSYEFESLQWNENRAILKANVKIKSEPSITDPSNEGFDASGTAVLYLEADGNDVRVVNFELQ